jgi:hypothetical protein
LGENLASIWRGLDKIRNKIRAKGFYPPSNRCIRSPPSKGLRPFKDD